MSAKSVRLPPRRSLPREVTIPVLPGLGQTWYDRHGASYWIRRAGMSFLWAALTALVALVVVSVLIAFHGRSLAGFLVLLGLEVAYMLGILGYVAVVAVRHWNDPEIARQMFSRSRRGPGSTRPLHVLAPVLLALSCLSVGPYLALLMMSVLPETLAERRARLWVAGELRGRGHLLPDA